MFQRLSAFFDSVWAFILTLVRSLFALFSLRRRRHRASDPSFTLPRVVNRTPNDALARAHSRLRPILLTPRSLAQPRALNPRTRSATSTLATVADPQAIDLQRTSPKLGPPLDAELGLSVAHDIPALPALREGTPDTSTPTSSYVSPLTPPDRCYLAPLPSTTDCPYSESWPNDVALGKPRLPASPLKVSININSIGPMGSPPPGHWSPVQIWTSTPCKNDSPDPAFSPFIPALADVSNALISRSRSSIQPYNNPTDASPSSDASIFIDSPNREALQRPRERLRAHPRVPRLKPQPYPKFHHPNPYAYSWRRQGARLPGKADRTHAYTRSHSHMDILASEWYDANAYALSPVSALSPPRCESATEDEDEDEMPLGRLRERLARRNATVGATLGLGVTIAPKPAVLSPRSRRMSEGCLLAISESTPTRVGVGAHSANGHSSKDWLEALSLRFSPEHKDALAPVAELSIDVPSIDVVAA